MDCKDSEEPQRYEPEKRARWKTSLESSSDKANKVRFLIFRCPVLLHLFHVEHFDRANACECSTWNIRIRKSLGAEPGVIRISDREAGHGHRLLEVKWDWPN